MSVVAPAQKPDYGIDAPGVRRGMLMAGVGGLLLASIATAARAFGMVGAGAASTLLAVLTVLGLLAAVYGLYMGSYMTYGSRIGNLWDFRTPDGSSVSVRVEGPLQTNASDIVRAAVLDGVGIAYSPTWLFQDLIDSGEVQVLLPGWQTSPMPLHLVSPPERRHAAKVCAFSAHLASALVDCSMCS